MIRRATVGDVRGVQVLINYYANQGLLLPRSLSELYERVREFVVYSEGNAVYGTAALVVYWEDLGEIRSLAVAPGFTGKGIGGQLVEACLAEAKGLGLSRVFALTYRPEFFHRLGFWNIRRAELPQKIWKDCSKCTHFFHCDEHAVIVDL